MCNKNKLHQNHTNILKKHINGEIPSKYLSAILNKRSKDAKMNQSNMVTSLHPTPTKLKMRLLNSTQIYIAYKYVVQLLTSSC